MAEKQIGLPGKMSINVGPGKQIFEKIVSVDAPGGFTLLLGYNYFQRLSHIIQTVPQASTILPGESLKGSK